MVAHGIIAIIALVVIILLRVPIGVALGTVGFIGIVITSGITVGWSILGTTLYDFASTWTLSAIPTFLFMGYICYHAKITESIFSVAQILLRRIPGGLGVATIGGSAGFAAVTGSSLAAAAAMGKISVPEMEKCNYDVSFAAAICAAGGTIGSLIPPSILMIIFGVFTETSITRLFLGGIVPGLLTALLYSLVIVTRVQLRPELAPQQKYIPLHRSEVMTLVWGLWPFVVLLFSVLGVMMSGIVTATEAGAIGAGTSVAIALIQRKLSWRLFIEAVVDTLHSTASIFFIVCGAAILTRFFALTGLPDVVGELLVSSGVTGGKLIILLIVIYLILGMFLDSMGALLLTLPVVIPLLESQNISLIYFGVVVVKLLEVGLISPPVGMNVFVIKDVVGDKVELGKIFKAIVPFIMVDCLLLIVIAARPEIVTWLPTILMK